MRKIIYLALVLSMIFVGCQNEQDFFEEKEMEAPSYLLNVPVEHQKIIDQLGLDITTLVDKGDDYLLEGDIMLSKKEMKDYVHQPDSTNKLKQGYIGGKLVSLTKALYITVRIDASIPQSGTGSDWRQAVMRAINEWNYIDGTCLNFVYTTASSADITVKRTASSDDAIAWTWLPSGQTPAKEIFVNSNYDNYQFKANTLIHEMGHSIGLLHAHQSTASQGGIIVPGTPDIDNVSIMSYNRDRSLLPGFSNNDLIAIRRLYPADLPYIKVEKQRISLISYSYKVTFVNNQAGQFSPKVRWKVTGGSFTNSYYAFTDLSSVFIERTSIYWKEFLVSASQDGRELCNLKVIY